MSVAVDFQTPLMEGCSCRTCCCPCCVEAESYHMLVNKRIGSDALYLIGSIFCPGLCTPFTTRLAARAVLGYESNLVKDCLLAQFCGPCAMGQVNLELKRRFNIIAVGANAMPAEAVPVAAEKGAPVVEEIDM